MSTNPNTQSSAERKFYLHGMLVRAGTFPIRDEEITGVAIACSRHDIENIERLPMRQMVTITDAVTALADREQLLEEMTNAFLRWPLPQSVCADPCATKQQEGRIGTNLLSFVEAKEMLRAVVMLHLPAGAGVFQKFIDNAAKEHRRLRELAGCQPGIALDAQIATTKFDLAVLKAEAADEPQTSEERFLDRDKFVAYVDDQVNPARAKEELPTVGRGVASHLYDVLTSGRYRA